MHCGKLIVVPTIQQLQFDFANQNMIKPEPNIEHSIVKSNRK